MKNPMLTKTQVLDRLEDVCRLQAQYQDDSLSVREHNIIGQQLDALSQSLRDFSIELVKMFQLDCRRNARLFKGWEFIDEDSQYINDVKTIQVKRNKNAILMLISCARKYPLKPQEMNILIPDEWVLNSDAFMSARESKYERSLLIGRRAELAFHYESICGKIKDIDDRIAKIDIECNPDKVCLYSPTKLISGISGIRYPDGTAVYPTEW